MPGRQGDVQRRAFSLEKEVEIRTQGDDQNPGGTAKEPSQPLRMPAALKAGFCLHLGTQSQM